jgi:2Fe-2S ferredoxin
MDVTNRIVNQNINIYGLCDKQLACTTCRVDLESHYDQLPPPTEEEIDVLLTTRNFQEGTSRMACQIVISDEMEGMIVRIEREGSLKTNNID